MAAYLQPDFSRVQGEGDEVGQAGRHARAEELDGDGGRYVRGFDANHGCGLVWCVFGESRCVQQRRFRLCVSETPKHRTPNKLGFVWLT